MLTDLIWLRPQWFWLLLPLTFLILFAPRSKNQKNPWAAVCDPHLFQALTQHNTPDTTGKPQQMGPFSAVTKNGGRYLLLIAAISMITALAGPSWKTQFQPVYQKNTILVVALDMSPAMMDNDLPPSRLSRAKYKLRDFFLSWKEGSVGLIAYTREAFVASPLTTDTQTLSALLPALQYHIMPVRGSDANKAIEKAAELIEQSHFNQGNILLVTAAHIPDAALATAKRFADKRYRTHVYALRDDQQYQQLANAGGGQFIRFTLDDQDLQQIHAHFNQQQAEQLLETQETASIRLDQGYLFLWLLVPMLILGFRRGWLEAICR